MSAVCRERAFAVETTERQGGWGIQFYPFRFSRYIAQTIFPQKGRAGKHQSIRNTQQLKGVKPRRGYLSRRKSRFFGNSIDFELVPIKIHLLIQGDKSGQGGWVFCDFGNSTVILWTASQCISNLLFVDVAYPHSSQTWLLIFSCTLLMYFFKSLFCAVTYPHFSHLNLSPMMWTDITWYFKFLFSADE